MKRTTRAKSMLIGAVLGLGSFTGCLGTPGDGSGGGDDDGPPIVEQGLLCEGRFSITGSFAVGAPQPEDVFGCWPVGVWTFKATMEENGCATSPTLLPEYKFEVTRDIDDNEVYSFLNEPDNPRVHIKVSSGGAGICTGGVTIYSDDGKKIINLKPALQEGGVLNGSGEYLEYDSDQYPGD